MKITTDVSVMPNTVNDAGKIFLKANDGTTFAITPETMMTSPFDIKSIQTDITTEEILSFIRESRERG